MSNSLCELSLTSRDDIHIRNKKNEDARQTQKQKRKTGNPTKISTPKSTSKSDEDQLDMLTEDILEEQADGKEPCGYFPLVYKENNKTYPFQYFRTNKYDWRLTNQNGEPVECTCSRARPHITSCPWYNPDVIYMPDNRNDLSTSEQAAQGKIYNMYENTKNNPSELCGCGTPAEIAFMRHKTTCVDFQWIHERDSYEVLLAMLKKRKKIVSFAEQAENQNKRPRLQSTLEIDESSITVTKEDFSKSSSTPPKSQTSPLEVLAEVAEAQSHSNPKSLPDLVCEHISGADCPCEDNDEMPPLEDEEITEL